MTAREIAESIVRDACPVYRTMVDLSPISSRIADSPDPYAVVLAIADIIITDVTMNDADPSFKHLMHCAISEVPALEGVSFFELLRVAKNNKVNPDLA